MLCGRLTSFRLKNFKKAVYTQPDIFMTCLTEELIINFRGTLFISGMTGHLSYPSLPLPTLQPVTGKAEVITNLLLERQKTKLDLRGEI